MQMTAQGRAKLSAREGNRLKAYHDTKGIPTIGVGHTSAAGPPEVHMGLTITADQSDEILMRDLKTFEDILNKALKVPVADHEFDALLSIMFNVGPKFATSTAIRRLNAGDKAGVPAAIMMWNKPSEIIGRRKSERDQFLTPYAKPVAAAGETLQQPKETPMAESAFMKAMLANTLKNPDLLHGASSFLREFARKALEEKGVPENVRTMLHTLGDHAEDAAVAMVAGTPAEHTVPAAKVAEVKQKVERAD